jgi:hypothetical protein
MRTDSTVAPISRTSISPLIAMSLLLIAASIPASRVNAETSDASASAASGSSPCLQELTDQKAKADAKRSKVPGWLSRNARIVAGTLGAAGGVAIGSKLCKDESAQVRAQCRLYGGLGGALLGSKLGQMMSEAEQKRYQEAAYKVALTGRPQSLTLETGCVLVEAESEATFEERQFELALAGSVAPPQKLRAIATPHVRPSSANVSGTPTSGKSLSKVGANVPSFVMGSTDSGKWLLLGREDPEQNFVGAGYVDAKDWVAAPESTPAPIANAGGELKLVTVGVEVRCTQISSSIRVQASNKQETFPGKTCILPNGVAELPPESQ